jgi:hypothetical protein
MDKLIGHSFSTPIDNNKNGKNEQINVTASLNLQNGFTIMRQVDIIGSFAYKLDGDETPVHMVMEGLGYVSKSFDLDISIKTFKTQGQLRLV